MDGSDMTKVREELVRYVERHGYGAISRVADRAGITRHYLGRFKGGHDIAWKSVQAVRQALSDIRKEDELTENRAAASQELQSMREQPGVATSSSEVHLSRMIPIPSPAQIEQALLVARKTRDTKRIALLRELQEQVLGIVEESESIKAAFEKLVPKLHDKADER